ncbi:uncharacterized protein M6B38_140465 [Iris pallida]|uniref:Uncharacterized protein n=1 Tax=Iris pallida TaxID=29817 RepID=A0AAX6FD34_IRIPA|nr:uncharacterized protein M6B38_140465 [Iris pallida]
MVDLDRRDSSPKSRLTSSLMVALRKRRTWVSLYFLLYSLLLSSSWNLLLSIHSYYNTYSSSSYPSFPAALCASLLYGAVFGLLAMAAALAVAVPATLVTWITVLVLLAFVGRPRAQLVADGRRITADILAFALRILLREGNLAAACCALASFVALLANRRWRQLQLVVGQEERPLT